MMRLEDDIDFTTLNWVKQELDDTLRQARQALEAYVESPSDQSQMRFCASFLHQVQGTLRMVELYGAAMVVEEMERLVQSLLDDEIRRRDDSYGVLMRGIVQMPDYLERLQGGHKDIPIVLLPLLNDLRACRGEKLLSESVLFAPDLSATLPANAAGPAQQLADTEVRSQAMRLRTRYQSGLLAWIKNEDSEPAIGGLIETLDELRAITFDPETRRLWWIAAGLLDAARQRAVDIGSAVKLLFGKVDREIKRMADGGEQALLNDPPRELAQNLLYYLAHGAASGERVEAIRATYMLSDLLPTQAELEHAKGSIGGRNRALLDTVSIAIKEDLLRVKDALDLYLRRGDAVPAELSGQAALLDRVADTLGMLGLGVPRRVVQEQRRVLDDLSSGARVASEAALLDVAGALLYVEVSLDENIRTLGVSGAEVDSDAPVSVTDPTALPKAEVKRILDALLRESIANVQRAKSDVVAWIESGWEGERLQALPTALEEIVGAMRMLDQQETADLVRALSRFVEVELVGERRVPTSAQIEHLADAFTSIEYYLEATGESRSGREEILDVTRESLAALGYWPPPSAEELQERDLASQEWATGAATPTDSRADAIEDASPIHTVAYDATAPVDSEVHGAMEGFIEFEEPAHVEINQESDVTDSFAVADGEAAGWSAAASELADAFPEPAPKLDWNDEGTDEGVVIAPADHVALESAREDAVERDRQTASSPTGEVDFALRDDGSAWPDIGDSPVFTTEVLGQSEALNAASGGSAGGRAAAADDLIDIAVLPTAGFDESMRTLNADLDVGNAYDRAAQMTPASVSVADPNDAGFEWIEVEEEVEEEVDFSELPEGALPGGFDPSAGEDIDDDIREVFIEEVTEEITNIGRMLPLIRNNSDDVESLRNVRRSFHTLKGSGRLVGAVALGEFSWRVETMLNRVLERSIPLDSQVLALLEHSRVALDQLRTELRGMGSATALPMLVMQAADRLVAGEAATIETTRRVMRTRSVRVALPAPPVVEPAMPEEIGTATAGIDEQVTMEQAELLAAGVEQAEAEIEVEPEAGERMPEIEPMLLEVLRSEAGGYLISLEVWIEQARNSGNRLVPTADLLRAVHTLHGALGMVEVPVVAEVVGMLEGYLKRLVTASRTPSAEGIEAMADVSGVVGATLALLDRPGASVPPAGDLNQRLADLRDELPELHSRSIPAWVGTDEEEDEVVTEAPAAAAIEEAEVELASEAFAVSPIEAMPFEEREPELESADTAAVQFEDETGESAAALDTATPEMLDESVELGEDSSQRDSFAAELLGDVSATDWDMPQPSWIEPQVVEHADAELDSRQRDELAALGEDTVAAFVGDEDSFAAEPAAAMPEFDDTFAMHDFAEQPAIEAFDESALSAWDTAPDSTPQPFLTDGDDATPGMPEAAEGADRETPVDAASELDAADPSFEQVVAADQEPPTEAAPISAAERRRQKRKSARQSKREQSAADRIAGVVQLGTDVASGTIEETPEIADEVAAVAGDAEDIETDFDTGAYAPLPMAASAQEDEDSVPTNAEPAHIEQAEIEPANVEPAGFELADAELDYIEPTEFESAHFEATELEGAPSSVTAEAFIDSAIESEFEEPLSMVAGTDGEWQDEVDPDRPLVLPDLDADLIDIFVEEGREILDEVDPVLAQLRDDAHSAAAISAIQRHLHTIKGNARAVGLNGIGDVSHALETLIDSPHGRTTGAIELVQRGFDRLHRMVSRVGAGRDLAYPARLIAMIEASAAGVPMSVAKPTEHAVTEPVAEASQPGLEIADADTAHDRLALEEDVAFWREPEAVAAVPEEEWESGEVLAADTASDALPASFGDEFAEEPVAIAFEATDERDSLADDLDLQLARTDFEPEPSVDFDEMAAAAELDVAATREGALAEESSEISAPEPAIEVAPEPEPVAPAPIANVVRLDDYRLPAQVITTDEAAQRQSQELIRVRADLLDSLVNYAGEVSIYRARLEQQLGAFRINVGELEQTVERTREQLRKLDIETEAQIIARFQRETEDDQGVFDPLELDRFSNLQ
ncbi:MAG: Hpt domain-containing protein, partial [Lysobacterales bacterium]